VGSAQCRPLAAAKFEYLNPKLETNSKYKCSNVRNGKAAWLEFLSFEFGTLDIVSDLVLRISDFELLRKSQRNLALRFSFLFDQTG
jgi:hypothetical protein